MDIEIPEKSNRKVWLLLLFPVLLILFFTLNSHSSISVEQRNLLTGEIMLQPERYSVSGTAQTKEKIVVTAIVNASVREVYVANGDRVSVGQPLISLVGHELQARFKQEKLDLELLQAELESETAQLAQKIFELKTDQQLSVIELEEAKQSLEAYQSLSDSGGLSALNLKSAAFKVQKNEKIVASKRAMLEHTESAAKSVLAGIKKRVEIKAEIVAELKEKIERLEVKAEIAGIVTDFDLNVGDPMLEGQKILRIHDTSNFEFELSIPDFRYAETKVGAAVSILLPSGERIAATLTNIASDATGGFVRATAIPVEEVEKLALAQTVRAEISLDEQSQVLKIKRVNHFDGDSSILLYTVESDSDIARLREFRVVSYDKGNLYLKMPSEQYAHSKVLNVPPKDYGEKSQLTLEIIN